MSLKGALSDQNFYFYTILDKLHDFGPPRTSENLIHSSQKSSNRSYLFSVTFENTKIRPKIGLALLRVTRNRLGFSLKACDREIKEESKLFFLSYASMNCSSAKNLDAGNSNFFKNK